MKVLIDESLPRRLWRHLHPHQAFTADYQGWLGVKNGALLARAEAAKFEVFLTADKNVSYQQNLSKLKLGVVVLNSNLWPNIEPQITRIVAAIDRSTIGSIEEIEL